MIRQKITVINKLGLHARAATKLATTAGRYKCSVSTGTKEPLVDAKSIMSVMLLAAAQGTVLDLKVDGDGAQQAADEVSQLVNNYFDEGE